MAAAQVESYKSLKHTLTPPITPPSGPDEIWDFPSKRRKVVSGPTAAESEAFDLEHQEVLLLHAVKQRYAHTKGWPIPALKNDREMLVAVDVIGLNPIDWKAPYVVSQDDVVMEANFLEGILVGDFLLCLV